MTTPEEAHQFVREAVADSYDAAALIQSGAFSAERWETACRAHLERIIANASMETHSAWHDGDAVAFATQDFQLEQLANQNGGETELYRMLRTPLTRDQMLTAINMNEGAGISTTAANRERSQALREFQAARDAAYVEHGLLSQEAADAREFARVAAERREQGLDVVATPEPEELERGEAVDEPQYDHPPRNEAEAAERGDMRAYFEMAADRERRLRNQQDAEARARKLMNAGY